MLLMLPLVLAGPLLVLATAVVALWSRGPLGWLAAVGLVAGVALAGWWSSRAALRWWRSTKAPVREQLSAGRGPGEAAQPGPRADTSRA